MRVPSAHWCHRGCARVRTVRRALVWAGGSAGAPMGMRCALTICLVLRSRAFWLARGSTNAGLCTALGGGARVADRGDAGRAAARRRSSAAAPRGARARPPSLFRGAGRARHQTAQLGSVQPTRARGLRPGGALARGGFGVGVGCRAGAAGEGVGVARGGGSMRREMLGGGGVRCSLGFEPHQR